MAAVKEFNRGMDGNLFEMNAALYVGCNQTVDINPCRVGDDHQIAHWRHIKGVTAFTSVECRSSGYDEHHTLTLVCGYFSVPAQCLYQKSYSRRLQGYTL